MEIYGIVLTCKTKKMLVFLPPVHVLRHCDQLIPGARGRAPGSDWPRGPRHILPAVPAKAEATIGRPFDSPAKPRCTWQEEGVVMSSQAHMSTPTYTNIRQYRK